MITLIDALEALGISAYCKNNDYDSIVWTDSKKTVSKKDLESKVVELQKAEDATQYQRDRLQEYPSLQECIHAILDDDLEALQARRTAVKTKYPKPE